MSRNVARAAAIGYLIACQNVFAASVVDIAMREDQPVSIRAATPSGGNSIYRISVEGPAKVSFAIDADADQCLVQISKPPSFTPLVYTDKFPVTYSERTKRTVIFQVTFFPDRDAWVSGESCRFSLNGTIGPN